MIFKIKHEASNIIKYNRLYIIKFREKIMINRKDRKPIFIILTILTIQVVIIYKNRKINFINFHESLYNPGFNKYCHGPSPRRAGKLSEKAGKLSEATQKARTCSTFTFPFLYHLLYIKFNQLIFRDPVSLPCFDIK